jgi:hypothetical protein
MSNVPLTVSQLFTPASSGVLGAGTVPITPATGTWLYWEYQAAATIGMPTTAWQPGDPERTIFAVNAVMLSQDDALISIMAQGGFLDSAASGTVTYQDFEGNQVTTPVTPDPSIASQNPTGALGWLDLLSQNVYGLPARAASFASGQLALCNTAATSAGPYLAGSYHVSIPNGATYTNQVFLSIPSSTIAGSGGVIGGVSTGIASTTFSTAAPHGLSVNQVICVILPSSSGITLYAGGAWGSRFAFVTYVSASSFTIGVGSAGSWVAGGNAYLCTLSTFQADVIGVGSNAAPGQITNTITQANGVTCSNVVGWSGANYQSNTQLANLCRLSLAAASPNGPSQAYVYFAEQAYTLLQNATPSYTLSSGPVVANSSANPQTGVETVVVASSTPFSVVLGANVTPGCAQNIITAATNTTPVVLTVNGPCGVITGMTATVSGVLGNTGANGTFTVTVSGPTSTTITLNGSVGTGAYTGGGSVEGGDLGAIDNLLQNNVVPDAIVAAVTISAVALPVLVSYSVVVPAAYVQIYIAAVAAAIDQQTASYPIGGSYSPTLVVPIAWDDYLGALKEAGVLTLGATSYVISVSSLSVTVNGTTMTNSTQSVAFPTNAYQAIQGAISGSVTGV